VGTGEGIIIAPIIATHIARKPTAAARRVSPGMGIHAIDRVHPPGIAIPCAMARDQRIVPAALATKSSALTARKGPRRAPVGLVSLTM